MTSQSSGPVEAIVVVVRRQSQAIDLIDLSEEKDPDKGTLRSYDAFIYTSIDLSGMVAAAPAPPEDQPEKIDGLPLAAIETVSVRWDRYQNYLRSFIKGEKAASEFLKGDSLFEALSPCIQGLLEGELTRDRLLRLWWHSSSPNLLDLPWELLAYTTLACQEGRVSFVRGLPPETSVPRVPVGKNLRLAFIHDTTSTSDELSAALKDLPGIEVIDTTGPPLEALGQSIHSGCELIHLVADGSVSLANEGFLYLRKRSVHVLPSGGTSVLGRRGMRYLLEAFASVQTHLSNLSEELSSWFKKKLYTNMEIETLSSTELSAMQRGKPLAVICLSPPKSTDTDIHRIDSIFLPSVFGAFTRLASSKHPLPNIVAQIGAADETQVKQFWHGFYIELAKTHEIEKAITRGMAQSSPLPIALFLRQKQARTFQKHKKQESNVTQINAELQQSRETLDRLREQKDKYASLSDIIEEFEKHESTRQQKLENELRPFIEEEEA